jgi:hypothetical protein
MFLSIVFIPLHVSTHEGHHQVVYVQKRYKPWIAILPNEAGRKQVLAYSLTLKLEATCSSETSIM